MDRASDGEGFIVENRIKFDFILRDFTRYWLYFINKVCKQSFQVENEMLKLKALFVPSMVGNLINKSFIVNSSRVREITLV